MTSYAPHPSPLCLFGLVLVKCYHHLPSPAAYQPLTSQCTSLLEHRRMQHIHRLTSLLRPLLTCLGEQKESSSPHSLQTGCKDDGPHSCGSRDKAVAQGTKLWLKGQSCGLRDKAVVWKSFVAKLCGKSLYPQSIVASRPKLRFFNPLSSRPKLRSFCSLFLAAYKQQPLSCCPSTPHSPLPTLHSLLALHSSLLLFPPSPQGVFPPCYSSLSTTHPPPP